jgi:hypothetical protein
VTTIVDESNVDVARKLARAHGWILLRSEATLIPAMMMGGSTLLTVTVELAPFDQMPDPDVRVTGEGTTHVDATRNALGVVDEIER